MVDDIGTIGVSKSVRKKRERLTELEYWHITYHYELGERILVPGVKDECILNMVRHHHERYDGAGYPDELHVTSKYYWELESWRWLKPIIL